MLQTLDTLARRRHGGAPRTIDAPKRWTGAAGAAGDAEASHDDFELLKEIGSVVRIARMQTIIHEGDPAANYFKVISGAVRVYKLLADGRRQIVGFPLTGDFFGWSAGDSYPHTAEAISDVTVLRVPRKRLEALVEAHPKLGIRLLGMAHGEICAAQEQMLLLGRKTAEERIASFLVAMSERAASHGEASNVIVLSMTRGEIADYLGLSAEAVSRGLSALKREGLIAIREPQRIALVHPEALADRAEGDDADWSIAAHR